MTIIKSTTAATEADLEARIHTALDMVFPWLGRNALRHQIKFSFKLGRAEIIVDGKMTANAEARADIVIYQDDKPLAVMELKREGTKLNAGDADQAISYARMLPAPLAIVTNGDEFALFTSHNGAPLAKDGEPVTAANFSAQVLKSNLESISAVAAGDLKNAIATLLGPNAKLWMQAIRQTTRDEIDDLTGSLAQPLKPFVSNFLVPRKATSQIFNALQDPKGARALIISGPPLSGKSCVLRELSEIIQASNELAMLYIDAGSAQHGIFQFIANLFANHLNWPATRAEARNWIRTISNSPDSAALVLAIDGPLYSQESIRSDIIELTSTAFGEKLRVVLTIDEQTVCKWTSNEARTSLTKLGHHSTVVELKTFDRDEFHIANDRLRPLGALFVRGASLADEYRIPWLVRSILADILDEAFIPDGHTFAVLPPMLGTYLIRKARRRFSALVDTSSTYRKIAKCVLDEVDSKKRDVSIVLESQQAFIVTEKKCEKYVDHSELTGLISQGFAKRSIHSSNKMLIVPRAPELFASEVAFEMGSRLAKKLKKNPVKAARWLEKTSSLIAMGDVIGAQALVDASQALGGTLPLAIISALLGMRPEQAEFKPGFKASALVPDAGLFTIKVDLNGETFIEAAGGPAMKLDKGATDEMRMYSNPAAYLILSHMASTELLIEDEDGSRGNITPAILLEIASCPVLLCRPNATLFRHGAQTICIPGRGEYVCASEGMIEPVTLAIGNMISNMDEQNLGWVQEAISRESLPLVARIRTALTYLSHLSDKNLAGHATDLLENFIEPAFSSLSIPISQSVAIHAEPAASLQT